MPVRQSGFGTTMTPGTVTGAAPVTTSTGAVPPSRSRPAPRSTSRRPPSSTSALGLPSRFPSPAASSTPATVLARGGDPPEPPAGLRPGSSVTGPGPRWPGGRPPGTPRWPGGATPRNPPLAYGPGPPSPGRGPAGPGGDPPRDPPAGSRPRGHGALAPPATSIALGLNRGSGLRCR